MDEKKHIIGIKNILSYNSCDDVTGIIKEYTPATFVPSKNKKVLVSSTSYGRELLTKDIIKKIAHSIGIEQGTVDFYWWNWLTLENIFTPPELIDSIKINFYEKNNDTKKDLEKWKIIDAPKIMQKRNYDFICYCSSNPFYGKILFNFLFMDAIDWNMHKFRRFEFSGFAIKFILLTSLIFSFINLFLYKSNDAKDLVWYSFTCNILELFLIMILISSYNNIVFCATQILCIANSIVGDVLQIILIIHYSSVMSWITFVLNFSISLIGIYIYAIKFPICL